MMPWRHLTDRTAWREAFEELARRKLRTGLPLLGLVFGVGSIVAMQAVGEGSRREALRLHLNEAEIRALIKLIEHELEKESKLQTLPINTIAEKPELAVEHYKSLLSQIRQLAMLTDATAFDAVALGKERLSASEVALWRQIKG